MFYRQTHCYALTQLNSNRLLVKSILSRLNMIQVFPIGRGGHSLYDKNNHSYRIDEKINDKTHWKCIEYHCKARVHTKDDTSIDIIKRAGEHSCSSNPSKPVAFKMKSEHRSRSKGCAEKPVYLTVMPLGTLILLAWHFCRIHGTFWEWFTVGSRKKILFLLPHRGE